MDVFLFSAKDTYEAVKHLLSQGSKYVLQASVLSRLMIEILFNLIFIAQDVESRSRWFLKVRYKKIAKELERIETHWGNDLERIQEYLRYCRQLRALLIRNCNISQLEISDPNRILNWPIPSRMLKTEKHWEGKSKDDRNYLQHILNSYYGGASELAHVEFRSLVFGFATQISGWTLQQEASAITEPFINTATFFLSIMSEVARIKKLNLNHLLKKAWRTLYKKFDYYIDELIELRYSQFIDKR